MLTSGTSPAFWRVIETIGSGSSATIITLSRVDTFFDAPRDLFDIDIRFTTETGAPASVYSAMLVVEIVRAVQEPSAQTLA